MNIPDRVKRQLRAEVGFGCPVEDCGCPYLTYHHFDPPRRVREHNEPAGMIALCRKHHDDAEGGAFTNDQMRELKAGGAARNQRISGRFEWRRRQLLIHTGRVLTFEAQVPLAFNGIPVVSLTRDERNHLRLSINMLTTSVLPRLRMFENDWVSVGNPIDLEAPPFAKTVRARYPNGDHISVEFSVIDDADALAAALPQMAKAKQWALDLSKDNGIDQPLAFPAVLANIELDLPDAGLSITSKGVKTSISQGGETYGSFGACAVSFGHIPAPFPTMINAVGISRERPLLRLASMNDELLWHVSDRKFRHSVFLLDGFEFEKCDFDGCSFALSSSSHERCNSLESAGPPTQSRWRLHLPTTTKAG